MEGAARVFAGEFSRSTLTEPSDDAGSMGWVVTPGGAYCRQISLAGVLTEVRESGEMLRCRVADPTGAFDVVSWRSGAFNKSLQELTVPSFVAVTGLAQLYQKNRQCTLTIRPEQVFPIDRATRDQILLSTAEYTLRRLEEMRRAVLGDRSDARMGKAARHYSVTLPMVLELVQMVEGAVQGIRPQEPVPAIDQAGLLNDVRELIKNTSEPQGIAVEEVIAALAAKGIRKEDVLGALESLIVEDECYQPRKGFVRLL